MKKPVTSLTCRSPSSLCPLIISGLCSSHYLAPASSHVAASLSPSPTRSFFPAFHCHWGKVQITRCHQGRLPGSESSVSCLGLLAHLRLLSLCLRWYGGFVWAWFCAQSGFTVDSVLSRPEQQSFYCFTTPFSDTS